MRKILCTWSLWTTSHLCADQWKNPSTFIRMFLASSPSGGLALLISMAPGNSLFFNQIIRNMLKGCCYFLYKKIVSYILFSVWWYDWWTWSCVYVNEGYLGLGLEFICCRQKTLTIFPKRLWSIQRIITYPSRWDDDTIKYVFKKIIN